MSADRTTRITGKIGLAVTAAAFAFLPVHPEPPQVIRYQAGLSDDAGVPLSGSHDLVVAIYDAATAGSELWSETRPSVNLQNGTLDILLGEVTPLPSSVFVASDRWLEISVDGAVLSPRQRLSSLPFAHVADRLGDRTLGEVLDRSSHTGTQPPSSISPQGGGSGLDADTLDGLDSAALLGGAEFVLADAQSFPLSTNRADYADITAVLQSDGMNELETDSSIARLRPVQDTFNWALSWEIPGTSSGILTSLDTTNVTEGSGSYRVYVGYGGTISGIHALELSATVDLTEINEIRFDMLAVNLVGQAASAGIRVYIDGGARKTYTTNGDRVDETIDTSALSGNHTLRFRWEVQASQVVRVTESSLDNLRLIGSAVLASSVASGSSTDSAIDGDGGTYFESDPELHPWLQAEMSFEGEAEPAGFYIRPHATTTATALWIEFSQDQITWDRARTLTIGSDITLGTDNYVRVRE